MRYSTLLPALLAIPSTLARPAQPEIANTTTLPTHFGLLTFPHFQALDIFGPMDLLNSLFMYYRNTSIVPQFTVFSKTMDPVTSAMTPGGFGQEIMPTMTFSDYLDGPSLTDKGEIDVLIVPGGGGTRRDMTEEINFVKATYPTLKYIISVCTGATLLSRAGILDGRKATTNKAAWPWATSTGPNVNWVPTARWVEDGNIISTSGVSAGIDGTYAFVSRVYGEEVAHFLSLALEYNRETDAHHDPFGKIWDVPGAT
ncbi:DJ-1/PfpI family protein [Alternaria rosae]|uniref:DJ-1/PfpI family protein n=1 Tax=Alternaria rosae TaxID=1187941 RepID=UPI001E8CBCE5|nr:DJ-1/PfpI family protein [Alternaria rosae]KAH6870316.1 DJ-1/PfpI family protein [Alternaria rosae]